MNDEERRQQRIAEEREADDRRFRAKQAERDRRFTHDAIDLRRLEIEANTRANVENPLPRQTDHQAEIKRLASAGGTGHDWIVASQEAKLMTVRMVCHEDLLRIVVALLEAVFSHPENRDRSFPETISSVVSYVDTLVYPAGRFNYA